MNNLRLFINKNHSEFVEIEHVDDESAKWNIVKKTFSSGMETDRQILSFSNAAKRDKASRDLRKEYSHENGWYLFSMGHGWDALQITSNVPEITFYVNFVGIFEDDYEFFDTSNRNEAKSRAEVEFADYSVIDKEDKQIFAFEKWETQTKSLKSSDGSPYIQAFVKGWWWSPANAVEAVCLDEAEQRFLSQYSTRFSVVADSDRDEFIEFMELKPQGTSTVKESTLPSKVEAKLEEIEKQIPLTTQMSVDDLEWIFFGAINYQLERFGGTLPAIDYAESGTVFYQKWGKPNFGTEVGIYWPPNQGLGASELAYLLDLFKRFKVLWVEEPVYDEFLSLHISVPFEIPSLKIPHVQSMLIQMLDNQDWGKRSFLAAETCRLLSDKPAFA